MKGTIIIGGSYGQFTVTRNGTILDRECYDEEEIKPGYRYADALRFNLDEVFEFWGERSEERIEYLDICDVGGLFKAGYEDPCWDYRKTIMENAFDDPGHPLWLDHDEQELRKLHAIACQKASEQLEAWSTGHE